MSCSVWEVLKVRLGRQADCAKAERGWSVCSLEHHCLFHNAATQNAPANSAAPDQHRMA